MDAGVIVVRHTAGWKHAEVNLRCRMPELSERAEEEGVTSQRLPESGDERKIKCRHVWIRDRQGLGVCWSGRHDSSRVVVIVVLLPQDPFDLDTVVTNTVTMHLSTLFCILPQADEFMGGMPGCAMVESRCFVSRSPSVSAWTKLPVTAAPTAVTDKL